MSTLYVIRHGQASFGEDDYDRLSGLGGRQARLLAEWFDDHGVRFDAVYLGTLERHRATAEQYLALCTERGRPLPPVRRLAGLDEYDSRGILTTLIPVLLRERPELKPQVDVLMTDRRSFQVIFEACMDLWAAGCHDMGAVQSWRGFVDAVTGALDAVMAADGTGKTVALFTSGGPVSVAARRALSLDDSTTMRLREQIVNASFSRFKCTRDRMMLATFNEYPHLEPGTGEGLVSYR